LNNRNLLFVYFPQQGNKSINQEANIINAALQNSLSIADKKPNIFTRLFFKNKQNDTWKGSYKMKVVKIIIDDKETKALNVNEQNINLLIKIIELFEVDIYIGDNSRNTTIK